MNDSVVPLRRERIRQREAIVEHAESGAQNGLGPRVLFGVPRRPCQGETRSDIAPVVNVALGFIAQSEAQREIRPRAPLVAREDAHVRLVHAQFGAARIDAELRGPAAQCADL